MPLDDTGYGYASHALEKIGTVIALLSTADHWCKRQMETPDGRRCVLGAMRAAHAEIILRAPILHAINEVTGTAYRSIEVFNDAPGTRGAASRSRLHLRFAEVRES